MIGRELARRSQRLSLGEATGAADVVKTIRGKASEQASALTQTLTQSIREHGQTVIEDQKSRAATQIQHLGAAARTAAEMLHGQKSDALARYVDNAAERIDDAARYVQEMDLADIAREVEAFARRRPALLVGGLFLAGLGVARFIKAGQSSAQTPRRQGNRSKRGTAGRQASRRRRAGKSRRSTKD